MRLRYLKLAKEKLTENIKKSKGNDNQLSLLQQNNAMCHKYAQTIYFFKSNEILVVP